MQIPSKYANSRHICKLRKLMTGHADNHEHVIRYKKYCNLYNRIIRLAKNRYYCNLLESNKGDISATWCTLNELIGKTRDKSSCTSLNIDDTTVNNPKLISQKFCEFFTSVGQKCAANITAAKHSFKHYLGYGHTNSFFLDPITPGDVISIIGRMKSKIISLLNY